MVFGDPEGWWPLYAEAGAVNPAPEPKERADISLHRSLLAMPEPEGILREITRQAAAARTAGR